MKNSTTHNNTPNLINSILLNKKPALPKKLLKIMFLSKLTKAKLLRTINIEIMVIIGTITTRTHHQNENQNYANRPNDPVPVPDLLRKGAQRAPVARAEQVSEGRRRPAEVSDLRVRVQVHRQRFRVQRVQKEREQQRLARVFRCEGEQNQVHLQQDRRGAEI